MLCCAHVLNVCSLSLHACMSPLYLLRKCDSCTHASLGRSSHNKICIYTHVVNVFLPLKNLSMIYNFFNVLMLAGTEMWGALEMHK